jgi:hypothetical protein
MNGISVRLSSPRRQKYVGGNVIAGTTITGTKGKILGRAMAQTAVTCETGCKVETGPNPACNGDGFVGKYETGDSCVTDIRIPVDTWSCVSSTAACITVECVENLVSDSSTAASILSSWYVKT